MFRILVGFGVLISFYGCIDAVIKCSDESKFYCFDSQEAEPCYADTASYCKCTETSTMGTGNEKNVKWNAESSSCESDARTSCSEYKEDLRSFYKGECYSQKTCEDAGFSWIAGVRASCAGKELRKYVCDMTEHASWDATEDVCVCEEAEAEWHGDHCHGGEETPVSTVTTAQKWGYGIIAASIISCFAIVGVLIVLLRHSWWYQYLLSTMVALAMGCLLSDAILHLIPLALGLHAHEDEEGEGHEEHDEHDEHGEEGEMSATERRNVTVAITLGIYAFMLFEKAIHYVIPHQHSHGGGETHVNPSITTELKVIAGKEEVENTNEKEVVDPEKVEMEGYDDEMKDSKPKCDRKRSILDHLHEEDVITRDGSICAVDSVAWMVIFGDAMHNFADGLVMGAAFTNSLATGLATSIAVFCHEVPHELGDFAVLLNAGMKIKYAVLFNFLSACTCFIGLFVGLAIGSNDSAQKWIFALTAGMFIYISCVDLMPLMDHQARKSASPLVTFALQQLGTLTGFLMMWLLAIYEADIEQIARTHDH